MNVSKGFLPFLVFCLAAGIFFVGPAAAGTARATLEGVTRVHVSIAGIPDTPDKTGLSAARIRAVLDRRLREAGIPVMKTVEYNLSREKPNLRVEVRVFESKSRAFPRALYTYSVRLFFTQEVLLVRNPAKRIMAPTWNTPSVLGLTADPGLQVVEKHVNKLLERFIKDYRAANSLKSSAHP